MVRPSSRALGFRRRYREELDANPVGWEPILDASRRGAVTLIYSAHDTLRNGALVLRDYLVERDTARPRRGKRGVHRLTKAAPTRPAATRSSKPAVPKKTGRGRSRR